MTQNHHPTQKQHPIGSGFTAASTADDVLAGIDLSGNDISPLDDNPEPIDMASGKTPRPPSYRTPSTASPHNDSGS